MVALAPPSAPPNPPARVLPEAVITWQRAGGAASLLLFLVAVIAEWAPTPNRGLGDSAAILAIITGAAVGIERVLETFWTIIGLTKGAWWPLNTINTHINTLTTQLDSQLAGFYNQASAALAKAAQGEGFLFSVGIEFTSDLDKQVLSDELKNQFAFNRATLTDQAQVQVNQAQSDWTITDTNSGYVIHSENQKLNVYLKGKGLAPENLAAAMQELEDLKKRTEQLKALAPDNQRIQLIATTAFQNVSYLEKKYAQLLPDLTLAADVSRQAITGLSDFVATFKENPGRRLLSIYIGVILGLIVAGVVGLDLFQAAGNIGIQIPSGPIDLLLFKVNVDGASLFSRLGVALTGLVIGLGSNPTHEVIRTIQEIKKSRTADNGPQPELGGPTSGIGGFGAEAGGPGAAPARRSVDSFSLRRGR